MLCKKLHNVLLFLHTTQRCEFTAMNLNVNVKNTVNLVIKLETLNQSEQDVLTLRKHYYPSKQKTFSPFGSETEKSSSSFMFLSALIARCLRSSTSPRHQRPGARGHFAFIHRHQLQSHRHGDSANERDKDAGVLCVRCRFLQRSGSTLVIEYFSFYT